MIGFHPSSSPRIAIAGGGPAGAVVAKLLAYQGFRPVVFEMAAAPQEKVGECLPPESAPILDRLGLMPFLLAGPHLRAYGNRFCWGSERPLERDFLLSVYGTGWHVNRRHFEDLLAQQARESGAEWRYASCVTSVRPRRGGWVLTIEQGEKRYEDEADFLVDATGRRAHLARQLGAQHAYDDHLVALVACLEPADRGRMEDTFTLVETVPSGWWYSSLLPDGRLIVMYLTDHDLSEFRLARQPEEWWNMLEQTRCLWSTVRTYGYQPCSSVQILPANSARRTVIQGERWLAVGDAAAAYDPLSSHGITTALGTGWYAAHAINGLLDGQIEAGLAYLAVLEKAYRGYLEGLWECYLREQRWSWHPFWCRRHQLAHEEC